MRWVNLRRFKIKVFGKPAKVLMKGMTAPEEHTHFLHSLLTNNIKALEVGRFNYNLWLRQNGQPVGDFFVYRFKDHFLLDTEKPAQEVIQEFEKLKLSLKVYFEDLSSDHIFLFGEGSKDFVKDLVGEVPQEMSFVQKDSLIVSNNPLRIREEGFDLFGDLTPLKGKLTEKDQVSQEEFEHLRIERIVPRIGKDLRAGFSPLEACVLKYAIDMNKGCYVGQEAIARVYFRGRTPRVLALFEIEGKAVEGEDILAQGKKVGTITSVSPLGKLALGYILRANAKKGEEFSLSEGKAVLEKTCEEVS